jgi:putative ABC transport system permease protein
MSLAFNLAWRQLRSQWAAGEIRVLLLALVMAVAATTSVGFFTDRIQSTLARQGAMLLGADAVIVADHPIPPRFAEEARQSNIQISHTLEFPSMVLSGERSQLSEIKALGEGFPLRGALMIQQNGGTAHEAQGIPAPGTVWIEPRLANSLQLQEGDSLELGNSHFKVSAILYSEASRGGDMFSFAPRVMMNAADVQATGLIQFGSRVKYQLLLAADAGAMKTYTDWAQPLLARGERLQDLATARPEIRNALEKTQQFLGLAAMVSVVLAMVAMFLAAMPYVQSSQDSYALMRCFGASGKLISRILLLQTLMLAVIGSALGSLLGFVGQLGLGWLAGKLFVETLPAPSWQPALAGFIVGFATLLAVMWPSLLRLRNVPALHILRQDIALPSWSAVWQYTPSVLLAFGLIAWHAGDIKLALAAIGGFSALIIAVLALTRLLRRLLLALPQQQSGAVQLGLAAIRRRPRLFMAQVLGFSLGMAALMLLALIRGDLLHNWQSSLPPDAPNRFVINIQADQLDAIKAFFKQEGLPTPELHPMVRARLTAINGKPLDIASYKDERAKRLAEREFNLSWAADMQDDNRLLAGQWWTPEQAGQPLLSLEQGIADMLHVKLGDHLSYDVAGQPLELMVSSLRKVEWDTMRANFFALTPPGVLDAMPANYLTSLHVPRDRENMLNRLVQQFTNLTVIDVAAVLEQVQAIINKMTSALQYIFGFSVLAGLIVLYAALVATRRERVKEATLLRVLGASTRQIRQSVWVEYLAVGLMAALVASLIANGLAFYISQQVLNIPFSFNWQTSILTIVLAMVLIPMASWWVLRRFLRFSPREILHST